MVVLKWRVKMKYLWKYAKKYLWNIALAAVASVGCSVSTVMVIDTLKQIIDVTAQGSIQAVLPGLLIRVVGVIAVGMLSNYLVVAMTGRFGSLVLRDIRKDAIDAVMRTSPDFMEKNNFGDIMERLSSDVEGLAGYMQGYFKDCLYVPIIVVVYLIYLFSLNAMLTLSCVLPLTVLVLLSIRLLGPVKKRQFQYVKMVGLTNNNIQEAFDGVDVVKSYNMQSRLQEKYYKDLKATFDVANKNDVGQYNVAPINMLIVMLPNALAMGIGGQLVFKDVMTLGMLIAFISAIGKLIDPLESAYQLVVRTQMAMISVDRVMYCMGMPEENAEAVQEVEKKGNTVFHFEKVGFSYDAGENKVIKNVNLDITEGQRIAFVGRSGSGKSTLVKLLCRQYEVTEGSIAYYNQPFERINPKHLRKDIALISQDSMIFPMSVRDNIRIGNPDATEEQIIKATQDAGCLDFIRQMPQGFDSVLEEKGGNLSGGQKQRLAIARAILKDAPILLLDEPTSALDKETESTICETLADIAQGKTVITVAHRLTTIQDYDTICVVEAGEIIEKGSHEELMERQGVYCSMFHEYNAGGDC